MPLTGRIALVTGAGSGIGERLLSRCRPPVTFRTQPPNMQSREPPGALRSTAASTNIACSQIDIGNAATRMTDRITSGILQAKGTMMVVPRLDVRHVAETVVYIASLPLEANVRFMTLMASYRSLRPG